MKRFEYVDGYYNRFERESFGYHKVFTEDINTAVSDTTVYRQVEENYFNYGYLSKGLKSYEVLRDSNNYAISSTEYYYARKDIETGEVLGGANEFCEGEGYIAIDTITKFYYDAYHTIALITKETFRHGPYGNVVRYENRGATNDDMDGYKAQVHYYEDNNNYIVSIADSITVSIYNPTSGPDTIFRIRAADVDSKGRITEIRQINNSGYSQYNMSYDSYGNLSTFTLPPNHASQRYNIEYTYDSPNHQYVTEVQDVFNYSSQTAYDYRFAKPTVVTDISGNNMEYTYDGWGRIKYVRGPNEIASGAPYTIAHTYWNDTTWPLDPKGEDSLIWAKTSHRDPADTSNDIHTVIFADGLGHILQTKKDAELDTVGGYQEGRIVSGRTTLDPFGRVIRTWYPTTEFNKPIVLFNDDYDDIDPRRIVYDELDRTISDTLPDDAGTTTIYDFGEDQDNIIRFLKVTLDPEGSYLYTYTNSQGKTTRTKAPKHAVTTFRYNAIGELMRSTDPEGDSTTYSYDMLGKMISRTHPDAGTTTWEYDPAGNLRQMQTQVLDNISEHMIYTYYYNRLSSINFPLWDVNDVEYEYGVYTAGNQAGRLTKQYNASGLVEFEYGKMGELIKTKRYMPVRDANPISFETRWAYDSWNRVDSITYPDGEVVNYHYDHGGKLFSMDSRKDGQSSSIIDSTRYDKFERRHRLWYGNGTKTSYEYDPERGFLTDLMSHTSGQEEMQNNDYTFDLVGNILTTTNAANPTSNGMGGGSYYNYSYDSLYRLDTVYGHWNNGTQYDMTLGMHYSASGKISRKTQTADLLNAYSNPTTMDLDFSYSYNSGQPHTIDNISGNGDDHTFAWDVNGNMTQHYYATTDKTRFQCWDEMNRLYAVREGDQLSHYIYDANGERAIKYSGTISQVQINQYTVIDYAYMDNYTFYVSPMMVVNNQGYTKHYFAESQRVMSKIGAGLNNSLMSTRTLPEGANLNDRAEGIEYQMDYSLECLGLEGDADYSIDLDWLDQMSESEGQSEEDLYFYHPDHLGSSSFISDASGEPSQHMEYLPFGELFIEERNSWNTPYKFSAKELDDETGYSYFGARYYDPNISIWLSVDPESDKYPDLSPYLYCAGNPIIFKDPDGNYIKPVNEGAQSQMSGLVSRYQKALGIRNTNGVYGSNLNVSNYREFKEQFKKQGFSKSDTKEGWALYRGLSSKGIIEVSVTNASSPASVYDPNSGEDGTEPLGGGLGTLSDEYQEFYGLLKEKGTLTQELSDALYNGTPIKDKKGDSHNIVPDLKGTGWAFFGNRDKSLNVTGHVLIDGSNNK